MGRSLKRAEKKELVRAALFDAAAKLVGEVGYAETMVAMITARAGVANGTFYNYFESRQDMFNQLLPALGREMLDFISHQDSNSNDEAQREEARFRAFFEFLNKRPEFYRILYEAEVFAPRAFQEHTEMVASGYTRVLGRGLSRGGLRHVTPKQVEAIAWILMGARHYLAMRYCRGRAQGGKLPEAVVETFMTLVSKGVFQKKSKSAS